MFGVLGIYMPCSSPEYAVKNNNAADFAVLAPGQVFELTHNLAGVYNFTNTGAGEFKVCDSRWKLCNPHI